MEAIYHEGVMVVKSENRKCSKRMQILWDKKNRVIY